MEILLLVLEKLFSVLADVLSGVIAAIAIALINIKKMVPGYLEFKKKD
ncbi:hypothetical protein [Arenicella chitinivorans]|nr:hypothetical protein [Arenicella chitinivorans]